MTEITAPPRVRFAPSPTGYLHVGGARTALFNWLFARRHGGTFVLRIEDTDAARNTPQALAAILDGLRWLGLTWDEGPEVGGPHGPYFQSQRQSIYDGYCAKLLESGAAYTEDSGAVRFRSPRQPITLADQIAGETTIDRSEEPDMTIRRPDGSYIFHFVNVIDDLEMQITHVIRGADHLYNTGKHLELFRALGHEPPVYAHIPLILNQDASKMSKRDQGAAVDFYIRNGFVPEAVRNYLCLLGWSPKDEREVMTVDEVTALFRWENMNRANAKFDLEKCRWMNGEYVKREDDVAFAARCAAWLAPALALIKPKVRVASEAAEHLAMLLHGTSDIAPDARAKLASQPETKPRLAALATALAEVTSWHGSAIQDAIAAAAMTLFPLRVAITGHGHGVDLVPALEIIGKEETLSRLQRRSATFDV
jgi:glutamyl/glutaminyl-tRNA synthetase